MKNITKENLCRVSDRAYRIIISDVIDSMTGCKIDPFTFKQVVTAVRHYLKPEGKPTGLGRKAKVIFDRLLPDLDRAIRRSATARAAAARRKEARKNTETEPAETTTVQPERTAKPESAPEPEHESENSPAPAASHPTAPHTRTPRRPKNSGIRVAPRMLHSPQNPITTC
mgnify:CR=1 FL=1